MLEKDTRRRLKKMTILLLIASLSWCVILGIHVWRFGMYDGATKSDCIIVLGATVQGATASPVYEERIRHGIRLYHSGYASKLLFTGGIGDGQIYSEASVGRTTAIQQGVPEADILVEEKSRTTQQNLSEARAVMRQHGIKSAMIVSDPLHMKRAMMMAGDLNISAASSPTPTSRYKSLKTELGFLICKVYFIYHYFAMGR